MKLADAASDVYSQDGEDGMLAEILSRIGEGRRICVEFGAADGLSCSNTARLWRDQGWHAVLIEADWDRACLLHGQAASSGARSLWAHVSPDGPTSVDAVLAGFGIETVDVMSIDVDGDDYLIWYGMEIRPRVVLIEYNRSIPPHVDLHQAELGGSLGASALALLRLATAKGYDLVGMTRGNMIFVDRAETEPFLEWERSLARLFPLEDLTYLATDVQGRAFSLGTPPWGYGSGPFVGSSVGSDWRPVDPLTDVDRLWGAIETILGPGTLLGARQRFYPADVRPEARARERLAAYLDEPGPVGVDVSGIDPAELARTYWIEEVAIEMARSVRRLPGLVVLTREALR